MVDSWKLWDQDQEGNGWEPKIGKYLQMAQKELSEQDILAGDIEDSQAHVYTWDN